MSIFKYAENIKKNLKNSLSNIVESIDLLERKGKKYETDIENLEKEREILKRKLKVNEFDLMQKKLEKEKDRKQKKNIETSLIVLNNSIEEMGLTELMNKDSIELMINRIKKIDDELCPVEAKKKHLYSHVFDITASSNSDERDRDTVKHRWNQYT